MDTARAIATSLAPFFMLYLVAMLGERALLARRRGASSGRDYDWEEATVNVFSWSSAMAAWFPINVAFFLHTELVPRLPRPIEWWLTTPSHHRVQHAIYGMTHPVRSVNPLWIQVHEYVAIARDCWNATGWRGRPRAAAPS